MILPHPHFQLLQVILEIIRYFLHQMNPVSSHHVMLCTRVREVIHLHVILDTLPDKAQTLLPNHNRVNSTLADQQLTFQIFCLFTRDHPSARSHSASRSGSRMYISFITHGTHPPLRLSGQVLLRTSEILQSPDIPYSVSSIPHGFLFQQSPLHPAQGSDLHAKLY